MSPRTPGAEPRPPRVAERLLELVVSRADRSPVGGDLREEYRDLAERRGARVARRWYWKQVLRSAPHLLARRAVRVSHRLVRRDGETLMETLIQDLRYAFRGIRRRPGFAAVVVLTLGLGIGANTVVFSAVDGVVLHPFPYPRPERLLGVGVAFPKLGRDLGFWEVLSAAEYLDIKNGSRTLEKVVAWDMGNRQVTVGDVTENLFSAFWWGDAFPTLGVQPELGRGFRPEEIDRGDRVAIISHRVWKSRFGGDPSIVGGTVLVNGDPYTLVGIMPPGALIFGTDLWIPMWARPEQLTRGRRQFQVMGRLAPGATRAQANAELETIARRVEQEYAGEFPEYSGWRLVARTWRDINVSRLRPAALILMGAVGFVLLLVCANVASLLLARSSARQRELALRTALGAGRWRIVRQLLTESVTLALAGGAVGVGLGYLGAGALARTLSALPIPVPGNLAIDLRVLAFTALIAVLAGITFGVAPALQAVRSDVQPTLRSEGSGIAGALSRMRLQRAFVGLEVALALILLAGGGLLIRSFLRLQSVDPGFRTHNMLTMRLTLAPQRYDRSEIEPFFAELRRRVQSLPGVSAVATASQFPPNAFFTRRFWVEGTQSEDEGTLPNAYLTIASPDYFQAMGVPLIRGRVFSEADRRDAPFVATINAAGARRYFPNEDPIGQRFRIGGPDSDAPLMEIVGVVGDTRNLGLDKEPEPEIYVSSLQVAGYWNQLFLLVRTKVAPRSLLPAVREQVRALDPEQPVYAIRTVDEAFAQSQLTRRVPTRVLTLLAVFALILAGVGIYGVVAFAAAQRTREIGVRMALGARVPQVRRYMVRQAALPVLAGSVLGFVGALALGRLISGLLFRVEPADPITLISVTVLLGVIALLASYVPARRASRLDPVAALRSD